MDTSTLDIVYVPGDAWKLGWDAIVGIGTLLLAVATVVAIYYSWRVDERRRKDTALQEKVRKEETSLAEATRNCRAVNLVSFQLIATYQTFRSVRRDAIEPFFSDPARDFMILPIVAALKPVAIDYSSLLFLLEGDDANVLVSLSSLDQEISATIEIIRERNLHHDMVIQAKAFALTEAVGPVVSGSALEKTIGRRDMMKLKQSTEFMIRGIDSIVDGCKKVSDELKNATRKLYPDKYHKIIFLKESE
jgi:hypothetical protein